MGGNPLAGNLGRSEYGRLKGETGRRGSKVPPHNPNSKEDPDSPGCTLGPIVCGPPRAQGPSAVASREPSGRQTPPDRTRAGPPHATKWYDMGNNPYSRVDQGLFDGMKPPRCLPRNSDQKVPLGIAKLERREGRLVGPRREAEAGVRVHGRRVARSPRMGQKHTGSRGGPRDASWMAEPFVGQTTPHMHWARDAHPRANRADCDLPNDP